VWKSHIQITLPSCLHPCDADRFGRTTCCTEMVCNTLCYSAFALAHFEGCTLTSQEHEFMESACAVLLQAVSSRPDPWPGVTLFNTDIQALYSISIVVFGFNCHANVVSVSEHMQRINLWLMCCWCYTTNQLPLTAGLAAT
jgi:hypothetical protein